MFRKSDKKSGKLRKTAAIGCALTAAAAGIKVIETASRELNYLSFKIAPSVRGKGESPEPEPIKWGSLSGFSGGRMDGENAVLIFGGSFDMARNAVIKYGKLFDDARVFAFDYYGCGESGGKMRLATMKMAAEDMGDAVLAKFPPEKVTVLGYSYGCGMAAYLASRRKVGRLILVSGYRSSADLYNIFTPVFYGPAKLLISQNIDTAGYARRCMCPAYIIGSDSDRQLKSSVQMKLSEFFPSCDVRIFTGVRHGDYFRTKRVIGYINSIVKGDYDDN